MTELSPSSPSATDETKPAADRQKQALLAALAGGPVKLLDQIKAVLALSQHVPVTDTTPDQPARSVTTDQARLTALVQLAEYIPDDQLAALYEELQSVDDVETRLLCTIRLALRMPPQYFQTIVRQAWQQSDELPTAEARARVLLQLVPLLTLIDDEPAAPPILLEIVSLAQAISNIEARIRSLMALVPHLPRSMRLRVLNRVLDEVDGLHSDNQRATALAAVATHLMPDIDTRAFQCAESIQVPDERARALTALARHMPLSMQSALRRSTLSAIGNISDEEARTEALIAFAPHLEFVTDTQHFPNMLEQALAVAISIKRRHLRARVLVALAPHMSVDLQGEALAAVHNLSNERERALLLTQLAPTLPANMLIASLAVAHSMIEPDARVQALTALALHPPENARERTMLDALSAASTLTHRYERVSALLALIDVLPPHLQGRAYNDALDATRLIDNENARARALSLLAPTLPPRLHERALQMARDIRNAEQRLAALSSIARVLDNSHSLSAELMAATYELPFEYKRARAIGEVADLLTGEHVLEALAMVRTIEDPVDRATAYIRLIPYLSAQERRETVIECWQLIRSVDNGYDAASTLSALAPLLPESAANDLARTAGMIIGSIMDEYDQASAITILAPLLAAQEETPDALPLPHQSTVLQKGIEAALSIPQMTVRTPLLSHGAQVWVDTNGPEESFRLWQHVMQELARQPLADTMLALATFTPVIRQFSGSRVLSQMTQVLRQYRTDSVAEFDR